MKTSPPRRSECRQTLPVFPKEFFIRSFRGGSGTRPPEQRRQPHAPWRLRPPPARTLSLVPGCWSTSWPRRFEMLRAASSRLSPLWPGAGFEMLPGAVRDAGRDRSSDSRFDHRTVRPRAVQPGRAPTLGRDVRKRVRAGAGDVVEVPRRPPTGSPRLQDAYSTAQSTTGQRLVSANPLILLVPEKGVEPSTFSLRMSCSTN